jgi:hypothetical protein
MAGLYFKSMVCTSVSIVFFACQVNLLSAVLLPKTVKEQTCFERKANSKPPVD